ncbi:type II secretion system protein [Candidatus Roizmanbacteria bacterium]|nr:type II secretion system protein [Candidatus Roizmanbacteria bacterium]
MKNGFTLPELIVVIGVFGLLVGLAITNVVRSQYKASLESTVSIVIGDIKNQQLKAMVGDTEGRTTNDSYGIFFATNEYTLFHGPTYDSVDSSNYTINLEDKIQFTDVVFPQTQIVFASGSGEVASFVSGSNSFAITNRLNGEKKTITINALGVITGVN